MGAAGRRVTNRRIFCFFNFFHALSNLILCWLRHIIWNLCRKFYLQFPISLLLSDKIVEFIFSAKFLRFSIVFHPIVESNQFEPSGSSEDQLKSINTSLQLPSRKICRIVKIDSFLFRYRQVVLFKCNQIVFLDFTSFLTWFNLRYLIRF